VVEGLWEKFHKNGNPFLKAFYKNGVLDGTVIRYYPSGKIEVKGQYVNDLKEGKWYFYSEDGHSDVVEYKNGVDENEEIVDKNHSLEYRNNIEKGKTITDPEHYKNNPEEYPFNN
jgi:antitoxin component YwqK of YwqJK toxin-antitoxin module